MKEKNTLPYGFYTESGTYRCPDCGEKIVLGRNTPLPVCPNYEAITHKAHCWTMKATKSSPETKVA